LLSLVFWDVQHGLAVYIKTPNNSHIVVDLGIGSFQSGSSFSPLRHLYNKYNVSRLDEVIITHPHTDHLDDIGNFDLMNPRVLWRPNHLSREEVLAGNSSSKQDILQKYFEINDRYNMPLQDTSNPHLPANNGGVTFQCFIPRPTNHSNLNNHSIVTVISYEGCKVLIPGDNESPSWSELLSDSDFIKSIQGTDVLLAPHHGREAGFHADLFKYIKPWLTVISDSSFGDTSATNRYTQVTKGLTVHRRNGADTTRSCVTTRNDGVIEVDMGHDSGADNRFISVHID
jgi:competence protein ComEC